MNYKVNDYVQLKKEYANEKVGESSPLKITAILGNNWYGVELMVDEVFYNKGKKFKVDGIKLRPADQQIIARLNKVDNTVDTKVKVETLEESADPELDLLDEFEEQFTEGKLSKDEYRDLLVTLQEELETEGVVNESELIETYSDEELDAMINKTYNQQKILNIYRRNKYADKRLFAHTRCIKCGREKRVFLSNLINDPDKYGSCICSDDNVEARLDNINDLYTGRKKLSNNTSGYTGVSYVKNYSGELYDKWRAYIDIDGKRHFLGDFDSKAAAVRARKEAAEKGVKWYKDHKNEFMRDLRKVQKRHRNKSYKSKNKAKGTKI